MSQRISTVSVQAALEAAAGRVILREPDHWAGWVTYLLEILDSNQWPGYEYSFDDVLEELHAAIDGRLETGHW